MLVVVGQVVLTPLIAFSLTYLFRVEIGGDAAGISIRTDQISWIIAAATSYGLLALLLALAIGGFTPMWVVDRGGWFAALGLSRRTKDAELVSRAELRLRQAPHGRLLTLVHGHLDGRRGLIETHGSLQLLAAPLQLLLAIFPVIIMVAVPESALERGRLLELGMIAYVAALILLLYAFPRYAARLIHVATFTRAWLVRMTRLSWMAPVLLMWLLSRLTALLLVDLLDADLPKAEFVREQRVLEQWIGIPLAVPEQAFLDLLVALAVLPLAAFTTVAAVSGAGRLPSWLEPRELEPLDGTQRAAGGGLVGRLVTWVTGGAAADDEDTAQDDDEAAQDEDLDTPADASLANRGREHEEDDEWGVGGGGRRAGRHRPSEAAMPAGVGPDDHEPPPPGHELSQPAEQPSAGSAVLDRIAAAVADERRAAKQAGAAHEVQADAQEAERWGQLGHGEGRLGQALGATLDRVRSLGPSHHEDPAPTTSEPSAGAREWRDPAAAPDQGPSAWSAPTDRPPTAPDEADGHDDDDDGFQMPDWL